MFPGNWPVLRGKTVEIIWVQPSDESSAEQDRLSFAKTAFRKTYSALARKGNDVAGVVIVFDSEDGGMAAATVATLQQWSAGHLSDSAFWKQVWLDPADSFKKE